ncbi:hypothetical protein ACH4MW_37860 [Streptomyces luteogriseus]|uniref:hypothetical protein n=1 Tax=Streptomyces luteogriseus TaxID=68233 RepID=UPI0036F0C13F
MRTAAASAAGPRPAWLRAAPAAGMRAAEGGTRAKEGGTPLRRAADPPGAGGNAGCRAR